MVNITDKTIWVVAPEVRSVPTSGGLTLLDSEREMYCDLALLAASVWLLIEWTPAGITVKEIVDLLETAAPLPRNMLETETCGVVADLARNGFVRKRRPGESVSERRNAQAHAFEKRGVRSVKADKGVVWLISPDALATYTQDGAVVLDVPKGICYSLNAVAGRIWRAMESSPSGITLEGIVDVLKTDFEISHRELEGDTAECLDKMQRMGLLQADCHRIPSSASGGGS
jgi:hypothetical protein